jgi:gentisate 1,2-dioxygenase
MARDVLPGEVAPAHRHSQSALRFAMEGHGAYAAVSGERVAMAPGDFIITPAWSWHDHGSEADGPVVLSPGAEPIPWQRRRCYA